MNPLNVRVVDDSTLAAKKVDATLEELGHQVVATARSGDEALEAYEQHRPDLVTLDITMPGMDGIETVKEMLERFPKAQIIMVTSNDMAKLVLQALKSGAKGYVVKPVSPEKLQEQIAQTET